MRHEAGLPNAGPMAPEDCLTENIKQNKVTPNHFPTYPKVGRIIEDSAQQWPKDGTKRQYHAMSRYFHNLIILYFTEAGSPMSFSGAFTPVAILLDSS